MQRCIVDAARDVLASSETQKNMIFAIRLDEKTSEKAEPQENKATEAKGLDGH
ncbi:hypothetical protein DPMN_069462 [Dreissena polymorpha]|uniref:Uncharacterized protein n=1 Tax=Dreissena polymorpha TaxID=45954 RepID=A0A9D4BN33_DREPO|nr:hypothetical protein DPMN_069462 [Dreissena polymorpha]